MAHVMTKSLDDRRRQETAVLPSIGATVRTSLITQLHPVAHGDRAAYDLLHLMAQTVAEFAALPEIRFIPTGSQSALALISAIWPERLDVKLTALATPLPHDDSTALMIVSAKITSESAPLARELADALLNSVPATTVTRITAINPQLIPVPNASDDEVELGAKDTNQEATTARRSSRLAIGWSVIQ
jgi:hypothetical protein